MRASGGFFHGLLNDADTRPIVDGNQRIETMPFYSTLSILLLCLSTPALAERIVTDSAGREVKIPERIERVYAAGPPASILTYMLAPDSLTGWPRAHHAYERPYIAPAYRDLPATGRLTGRGSTANLELVIALKPDLIVDFGSIRSTYVSLANETQAQTGIPYLLIDGRFENTPVALRLFGEILGVPERGDQLARYAESLFTEIDQVLNEIPESERPTVYLAREEILSQLPTTLRSQALRIEPSI